ncbi:MAG TPA: NAD(P)H-dependent oxidoreductase subunit E [Spirochaetales bacterium]|nr:NAD(P)H-dependent oxidoreductase subunit E [Spirochaetales bacterium]HPG85919.1 NAD(P)H-dependent oxidoreductase subunit E [Spirochaetales bacterium]HPM73220.1 NAD(P)H-dependent oxidoreductase subunit E [Spirochaetales bacterium]
MTLNAFAEARRFEAVVAVLDRHGRDPSKLIPILQAVQDEYRYLPEEIMTYVATALDVSPAKVYGVATFYGHFSLEPKGKHVLKICDGTACHVKGSGALVDALRSELRLEGKAKTTPDLLFTLETVSCLGACGLAPVLVVGDDVHGLVTKDEALRIVRDIKRAEASDGGN